MFNERHYHLNRGILRSPNNICLEGCWQSEKYFADIEDIIRHQFTIKYSQDVQNCQMSDLIKNTHSVSLHIRRGDYVKNSEPFRLIGTCTLDYYERAVQYIAKRITKPHFFIFSDDHQWVKENLKMEFPMTRVEHNDDRHNYEDLRLMSQCQHHIIANSSFSWWGAWLNPHHDKIVVAPRQWFKELICDTSDLIPRKWVRL